MAKRRRNSLRHKDWHYGTAGYYFVTICTHNRICLFDSDDFKQIAESTWQKIPSFKSATMVRLDAWVVMPNHVHGILVIVSGFAMDAPRPAKAISGTVGALVGTFKSAVSKRINHKQDSTGGKVWQRGYYDRIIRNERELNAIRQYIADNPRRWAEDRDNLAPLLSKMTYHEK